MTCSWWPANCGAKISDTALFTAAAPPQALAGEQALLKKAFELKAGELGGPLETAKGIYIFKVKEKKPAELLPLAQVRGYGRTTGTRRQGS